MRTGFHQELDTLTQASAGVCFAVGELLEQATAALIGADLTVAHAAVGRCDELHRTLAGMEDSALRLLALQAPVARDLRRVVSGLWTAGELRRMIALAGHVAQAVLRRHPRAVVPIELRAGFGRMGQVEGNSPARSAGRCAIAIRTEPGRCTPWTTRWTGCTETCSPYGRRRDGGTEWHPRWTPRC